MNIQELGEEYRDKSDDELLRLALIREQLTPEANMALTAELGNRRIDSASCLEAAKQRELDRKLENERTLGSLGFFHLFGVGRLRLGSADRSYDRESDLERFRTTVFVVLFCFPLIPRGTYLIERRRTFPDQITVLAKLPLDWEQILKVWLVAATGILALVWAIKLLP